MKNSLKIIVVQTEILLIYLITLTIVKSQIIKL